MGKNNFFRERILTHAQQLYQMRLSWPGFTSSRSGAVTFWQGQLTPTSMSDTYTLCISYKPPRRPEVTVITPRLRTLSGKRIPHTFSGDKLCLHIFGEWHGGKAIAHTIVHWATFWLFFYETWLLTEKWLGAGHEPPPEETQ